MSTTVHVKNISTQTSEKEVRDFFSFCGKISNITVTPSGTTQTAAVTFEKPTAAKTALLLDNTQLGPSLVHVSSTVDDGTDAASHSYYADSKAHDPTSTTSASHNEDDDVSQEDKPRSRIIAEYLAHGYTISDNVISRAIAVDTQHGYSARFTNALKDFDDKYQASASVQNLDAKYGVSEKAAQGWAGLNSYFEKALGTPSGQRVREFYGQGQKQVLDVHKEARRLADLRQGRQPGSQTEGVVGGDVPLQDRSVDEKAHLATQ